MTDEEHIDVSFPDDLDRTESGIYLPPPEDHYVTGCITVETGLQLSFVAETDEEVVDMAKQVAQLQKDGSEGEMIRFQDPTFGLWHYVTPAGARRIVEVGLGYAKKIHPRAQRGNKIVVARASLPRS